MAIAVLNEHPVLRTRTIFFSAPGDPYGPCRYEIWSSRTLLSDTFAGPASAPRACWMDDTEDEFNVDDPWPTNAPGPEHIYAYCSQIRPVFKVLVFPASDVGDCDWTAVVHFHSAADAAALDRHVMAESCVLGWKV